MFPLIPVIIIHQMEIHGLLCFHGAAFFYCLVDSPVGQQGLLVLRLLDRGGKNADAVCDDRNQVGHYKVMAAVGYLFMKLGVFYGVVLSGGNKLLQVS